MSTLCMWYSHVNVTLGAMYKISMEFYCLALGIQIISWNGHLSIGNLGIALDWEIGWLCRTFENWMFCFGYLGIY